MDKYMNIEMCNTSVLLFFNITECVTSLVTVDYISVRNNETHGDDYILSDADRQRIIIIAVIMAFTLTGNITLILVLLCKRSKRQKRVNILLLNLAFGDLAIALFVNSTEILFLAFGDWPLGSAVCKISVYVQMVCLSSATNLLTAMSIDRYQVIVKPMQTLARRSWIWGKISIAWLLSLIFPIPQLFIFVQYVSGVKYDGTPRRVCGSRGYSASWQRKIYFTYTTIYILLVPMFIMMYCYFNIIKVVWIRANNEARRSSNIHYPSTFKASSSLSTPATSSSSGEKDTTNTQHDTCKSNYPYESEMKVKVDSLTVKNNKLTLNRKESTYSTRHSSYDNKSFRHHENDEEDSTNGSPRMSVRRGLVSSSKRRVLIMTLTVVISFLLCQTPYFCINFVRICSDYKLKLEKAMIASEFMVMVHSTLNPLLYGLFTLREYHIKYIFSVLTCTRGRVSRHGRRSVQFTDERHELIASARSSLVSFRNGRTSTTTLRNSYKSNIHVNPLIELNTTIESVPTFEIVSSKVPLSESSHSTTILKMFRSKSIPRLTRTVKREQMHNSDTVLFANAHEDTMPYSNPQNTVCVGIECGVQGNGTYQFKCS